MSIPKNYYRYGIAAEKKIFEEVPSSVEGFVLPAQLVIDQKDTICKWLNNINKKFAIDPMTHVFFSKDCDIWNKNHDDFRRSYKKIREEYGEPYSALSTPDEKIDVSSVLDLTNPKHEMFMKSVISVINFQLSFVRDSLDSEIAEMYSIAAEQGFSLGPGLADYMANLKACVIIPPYLFFKNTDTQEYQLNKLIWQKVKKDFSNEKIYTMIATYDPLSFKDWDIVIQDLKGCCEGVILWFAQISELDSTPNQLIALRKVCNKLSNAGFKVCIHAGGAFSMGLGYDGVSVVSSGITYGESRPEELVIGGPVAQKYYVPELLNHYPKGDIMRIIASIPISCNNQCCSSVKNDFKAFEEHMFPRKKPESLSGPTYFTKLHHLHNFKKSVKDIWSSTKEEGIEKLKKKKEEAALELPSKYWGHLETWIKVYEAPLE